MKPLDPPAKRPSWAVGLVEPQRGERFRAYWIERIGLDADAVERCLEGLSEQTIDCAHLRVSHLLRVEMEGAFLRYIRSMPSGERSTL